MMKMAMTQLAIMVAVVGSLAGCGSGQVVAQPVTVDYKVADRSIVGSLSRDRLIEAARQKNQQPLRIQFEAVEKTSGQTVWPEMTISGIYNGQKFKGIRLTSNGRSVDLVPRSLVNLISGKLPFDFFDSRGHKIRLNDEQGHLIEVAIDFSEASLPSPTNRANFDEIGLWLLRIGAVALAVAIPALLIAGVFGIALVVTVGVARVIGSLIWAIFQIGLLAFATGLVIAIWRLFVSDADAERIKDWFKELWRNFVSFGENLLELGRDEITTNLLG